MKFNFLRKHAVQSSNGCTARVVITGDCVQGLALAPAGGRNILPTVPVSVSRNQFRSGAETTRHWWLETSAHLRHYAKQALTPRSLNVKLGLRRNYHKGRAAIRHYANQTACPLLLLRHGPNFTLRDSGVNVRLVS